MSDNKFYLVILIGPIENDDLRDYLDDEKSAYGSSLINKIPTLSKDDVWLYGFTINKKELKKFLKLRDKSKLVVLEYDYDSFFKNDEDYKAFCRRYGDCQIQLHDVDTKCIIDGRVNSTYYNMGLTRYEYNLICISYEAFDDRSYEAYEQLNMMDLIFGMLDKSLKEALCDVGFLNLTKHMKSVFDSEVDVDPFPLTSIDEMHVLIEFFGELFEGD